ncbi:MAG: hypothetical protein IAF02_26440 [Anaerolineae bacterium]|nr:hypothetical protein [Anaerolineae bacterium]
MWVLGFLPGVTHVISALLQHWFTGYLRQDLLPILTNTSPEALLFAEELPLVQDLAAEFFRGELLIVGLFWLFLALVGFWLIYTWAEAAIIAGSLHVQKGLPITLKQSLSIGWKFVGKFIAIDALVFFPWFVLALTAMILALIVLLGAVGMATQGASMESMMGIMAVGFGCVSLLGCLLLPLGFLTMQFRTLTFRDTAVFGGTIRESVKHTWQVVRANVAAVIILVAIMWGVDYVFGMVTSFITIPMGAITAVSIFNSASATGSSLVSFLSLFVALLLAFPKALLYVFIGIAWTLAYLDLSKEGDDATGH